MLYDRTFHPDEANQAFTTGRLLETGRYTYQPQDHHGPTLYYAAAAIQKAAGHDTLATMDGTLLRCTPLLFAVLALVFGFLTIRKLVKPAMGVASHCMGVRALSRQISRMAAIASSSLQPQSCVSIR